MSIYSGFPTRKDETHYNNLLARLLQLLQAHLLELLPEKMPQTKAFAYTRVLCKMQQYEEHKYLPPKFSELLEPLAALIGMPTKVDFSPQDPASAFETPKSKLNPINSNSHSRAVFTHSKNGSEGKEQPTAFRMAQERDMLVESKPSTRKGSQSVKKKQHKFHGSFYDIQERKIRQMHERYNSRVQEVNERVAAEPDRNNYRSHTESPADIYKELRTKYDPASKYGIVHMNALREAQQQVKAIKSSTPKQRVRTQFL